LIQKGGSPNGDSDPCEDGKDKIACHQSFRFQSDHLSFSYSKVLLL
jgi:hypothetical protein